MCTPILIGVMAVSAIASAKAAHDQSAVAQGVANNNAAIADNAATSAAARGEAQAQAIGRQTRQATGAQRAAFSARGVDIADGTPADIIDQTDFFGQTDAVTARNNGAQEAWGYRAQGSNFRAQAGASSPNRAAFNSLLGSAGSVASMWYGMGSGGSGAGAAGASSGAGVVSGGSGIRAPRTGYWGG